MLDMGEPVKIADLAADLIRLSGLEVGRDIDIVYTGLRPGEKLFEELFAAGEDYTRTGHEKIYVCRNGDEISDCELRIANFVDGLGEAAQAGDAEEVRRRLMEMGRRWRCGDRETGLTIIDATRLCFAVRQGIMLRVRGNCG